MDAFSAMLDGPRARGAFLLRAVLDPPWSLRVEDESPLALFVVAKGEAWVIHDGADPEPVRSGDVALVRGPDHYTVASSPAVPPQLRIDPDQNCWSLADGRNLSQEMALGVRTWGTVANGGCVMLVGCYDLTSQLTPLLLGVLPRLAVVPRAEWTSPLVDVLHHELVKDAPGQEVVLDRLLDLVLIEALRVWFGRPGSRAPAWWLAHDDPVVGPALRAIQADPAHPWTVAALAAVARVSRAALARRFTELVAQPPMAFVTDWRLSLAADHLRERSDTLAAVARGVGYSSPFALSTAFKRRFGVSPAQFRRSATAGDSAEAVL